MSKKLSIMQGGFEIRSANPTPLSISPEKEKKRNTTALRFDIYVL